MKLEIKHIAPYLPYGLGIKILNHKCDYVGIKYSKANGYYFIADSLHITYYGGSTGKSVTEYKPILRPLSDLTKEELSDFRFEHHVDCLTNEREHWIEKYGIEKYINETPYGHIQYLLSKHYDIYNLIPQGLAVDINTLEILP